MDAPLHFDVCTGSDAVGGVHEVAEDPAAVAVSFVGGVAGVPGRGHGLLPGMTMAHVVDVGRVGGVRGDSNTYSSHPCTGCVFMRRTITARRDQAPADSRYQLQSKVLCQWLGEPD